MPNPKNLTNEDGYPTRSKNHTNEDGELIDKKLLLWTSFKIFVVWGGWFVIREMVIGVGVQGFWGVKIFFIEGLGIYGVFGLLLKSIILMTGENSDIQIKWELGSITFFCLLYDYSGFITIMNAL